MGYPRGFSKNFIDISESKNLKGIKCARNRFVTFVISRERCQAILALNTINQQR